MNSRGQPPQRVPEGQGAIGQDDSQLFKGLLECEYTLGLDEAAWEAQLQIAARVLVSHPSVGPGF
ncbi:hypothetical protein [Streptomyces sp. NPDC004267]|uniref:hypothetical protein n=1 Tax=Streptomyces sp. NPDC004267 TaxID=3364694 RepID=UPI0036AEF359